MNRRIQGILFDWGGVLIENPAPGLMQYCAQALGVPTEQYTEAHNAHAELFQKGKIPEDVFWENVCTTLDCSIPETPSLWGQAFREVYTPREQVFALARQLRSDRYKTALLSNTEMPAMKYFFEQQLDAFDAAVFSCAEGMAKPERQIYEKAARKLHLPCEQCVFIDDNHTYVDGAVNAGMKGVLYEGFDQMCRALQDLDVMISRSR